MIHRLLLVWIRISAYIGLVSLLTLSFAIVVDVMLRWLTAAPIYGLTDIYELLIVCAIVSFLPLVVLRRQNVEVHLVSWLGGSRLIRIVDAFAHCCTLLFLVAVTWQCGRHALRAQILETPILGLPVAPVWWFAACVLSSTIPAQLIVLVKHLRRSEKGV